MFKKGYESEFAVFINAYLSGHPEILDDQRRGREIYWDKRADLKAEAEADADSVPAEQYYYYGWRDASRKAVLLRGATAVLSGQARISACDSARGFSTRSASVCSSRDS
jgi:hypothetical protein